MAGRNIPAMGIFDLNPAAGYFSRVQSAMAAAFFHLTGDTQYLLALRENVAWGADGLYVEDGLEPGYIAPRYWAGGATGL